MKKGFAALLLAVSGMMLFPARAYAGNINSAEQKILDAISGTFEYNGAVYKAADGYIQKVADYLNRDDIDMTNIEAGDYIRQIELNIGAGVSGGYLVPADGGNGSGGTDAGTGVDTGKTTGTDTTDPDGSQSPSRPAEGQIPDGAAQDADGKADDRTDMENNDSLKGFFNTDTDATKTGVVEDNTIGSTTDGAVGYTVLATDEEVMYVWDTDTLDVHSEAYKDSDVTGTLNKGDAVTVTGAATTGWAQIRHDGGTGYVPAVYLRTQGYMDKIKKEEEAKAEEAAEKARQEAERKAEQERLRAERDAAEAAGGQNADTRRDYSDAAPVRRSFDLGLAALVIVLASAAGAAGVILYHRSRTGKR